MQIISVHFKLYQGGISMSKELQDSWLSDGNCKKCRRKKYCTKQCKLNKVYQENIILGGLINKTSFGAVKKLLDKWG